MKTISQAWLVAALVTLMTATASASSIRGIGVREFDTFRGRDYLSMMGGAKLIMKTEQGLNENAGANYIQYEEEGTYLDDGTSPFPTMYSQLSRKCTLRAAGHFNRRAPL